MKSLKNLLLVIVILSVASYCLAEDIIAPAFPYQAKIIGKNINVRSGPGTNFYACGRLNEGDKITIVSQKPTWSQIVPPADSFSWIAKNAVDVDPNNKSVGVVNRDKAQVWTGSAGLSPLYSITEQLELDTGDKVALFGEEESDYYKIAPPSGAYLWVSTRFTEALTPTEKIISDSEPVEVVAPKVDANDPEETIVIESENLQTFFKLQEQLDLERQKPIGQQDYGILKAAFTELAETATHDKAIRYAKYSMKRIERYKLVLEVEKQVEIDDAELAKVLKSIDQKLFEKRAELPTSRLGRYTAIGVFKKSGEVTGYYTLANDTGKILTYALPPETLVAVVDIDSFIGKKVGLIGNLQPFTKASNALLQFTEITEVE